MAVKKKTKKKPTKSRKVAVKKAMQKKKPSRQRPALKKKSQKTPSKKTKVKAKTKTVHKKTAGKTPSARKGKTRRRVRKSDKVSLVWEKSGTRGELTGDLQGVSNVEQADSESVGELLEEGNTFEAGIVRGVEDAGNADEREVYTHEIPEDDVPGEYLDEE